jgi:hypothetical protein
MANVHELLIAHGLVEARNLVSTKADRQALEIAAEIMAEEGDAFGVTHSGFCMTALPLRRFDDAVWRRQGGSTILVIQSGVDSGGGTLGVPYGPTARMILLYLQSEAVRTQSREVQLGGSMRAWLDRMGIGVGGKTMKTVREQSRRISACNLAFFRQGETSTGEAFNARLNSRFVETAIEFTDSSAGQSSLFPECVRLDPTFYSELTQKPVPLRETALRQLSGRALALDIYVWLAFRLRYLTRETPVSWLSLHSQFGASSEHLRSFKSVFKDALRYALAAYPEAKLDLTDKGVTLHPSLPPVPDSHLRLVSAN